MVIVDQTQAFEAEVVLVEQDSSDGDRISLPPLLNQYVEDLTAQARTEREAEEQQMEACWLGHRDSPIPWVRIRAWEISVVQERRNRGRKMVGRGRDRGCRIGSPKISAFEVTKGKGHRVVWGMRLAVSIETPEVALVTKAEKRNLELGRMFGLLGPGRLAALEGVWQLCATDLHGLALWRTGSSQDAEDALQEVFIGLARAAERGRLGTVRSPFAYLLRMVHSAAIDTLRQRRRHQGGEPQEPAGLVEAGQERTVEAHRLSRHLSRLPEGQRAVVYLRHFVELSFREIGGVMGIPTFTAASRYRLALRRLRRIMGVQR